MNDCISSKMMKTIFVLFVAFVLSSTSPSPKANLTLEDRIVVLERRVDSIEAPAWSVINKGVSSWESCSESGPCTCAYLRRSLNCWERLGGARGIPPTIRVPRDVKIIDISRNDIPALPSTLFLGMNRLIELSVYNTGLESLPKYIFFPLWKLVHLKLGSNKLKLLPAGIFSTLPKLQTLDLSMNELVFLPRKAFSSNLALTQLDLSHNRLSHLPEGLLISQRNLTIIDASNNEIDRIKGSLGNLVSLESLILDSNKLSDLDWLTTECCPNLKSLRVSHNQIIKIPEGISKFPRLEDINIANNNIKMLSPSSLPPSIAKLDASRNEIASVDVTPATPERRLLADLGLAGNLLESFHAGTFCKIFPALRTLDLSNNIIGEADLNGLNDQIEIISLKSNLLDTLSAADLSNAKELAALDLSNNLWECSCKMEPFVRTLSSSPPKLDWQTSLAAACYEPEEMAGKTLADVGDVC